MQRLATQIEQRFHIAGHKPGDGHNRRSPIDLALHVGEFPGLLPGGSPVRTLMEKVEIVDRQHHRHPAVERQVARHLIGGVPQRHTRLGKHRLHKGAHHPLHLLLFPGRHQQARKGHTGKMAFGPWRQKEDRLYQSRGRGEQFAAEMERKSPQPAVDVPDPLQIDHHARRPARGREPRAGA